MATTAHRPVTALVVGWFSFSRGEATAGDVLSMEAVRARLTSAGVRHDVAWSSVMCPDGGLRLDDAPPERYTHLIFVCGPAHGRPVRELHERFAHCRRIAIGVTVVDAADPAVTGFHEVLPRDAPDGSAWPDLAGGPVMGAVPVVGVLLVHAQPEYGDDQRHGDVTRLLSSWLNDLDCARLPLDSRLDPRDWRSSATPAQFESLLRRVDVVVTTRLHGLVLALKNGVPALAVDPVAGGGKVTAQARAWRWPAALPAEELRRPTLDEHLTWCLSDPGRLAAERAAGPARDSVEARLHHLLSFLR
ncbi:polysaccharide pyruvyl transferase family protein [Sphaerisporangium album]|uniref:Polysaccharide pyruvyl transferase family protein n=1 Tax=Sphaerisporangium album TaxID=509200 RepID=A0A367FFJ9_9ACTN|nr:polysaccharide pyruvyl transferase family protein [Sphaerisporangium album]RCG29071.1 polysaccharide pyruvyl transferase family protein [Sphaerisporangium album]